MNTVIIGILSYRNVWHFHENLLKPKPHLYKLLVYT